MTPARVPDTFKVLRAARKRTTMVILAKLSDGRNPYCMLTKCKYSGV
jgi:hypothetical protein